MHDPGNAPALQRNLLILEADVGEEHVLFNSDTGVYCHLNDVGKAVWILLETPRTLTQVAISLSQQYAADCATCEAETTDFVDKLKQSGFIIDAKGSVAPRA